MTFFCHFFTPPLIGEPGGIFCIVAHKSNEMMTLVCVLSCRERVSGRAAPIGNPRLDLNLEGIRRFAVHLPRQIQNGMARQLLFHSLLGASITERTPHGPSHTQAGGVTLKDGERNTALMTCQHAIQLGKFAGHNAAASLLNIAPLPYRQVNYVTCLDLGGWGAVYTEGWEQAVKSVRGEAKKIKIAITNELIYPPAADRAVAFAAADPLAKFVWCAPLRLTHAR